MHTPTLHPVIPGTKWKHYKSQMQYVVLALTNEHSTDLERYPVEVVYSGPNGRVWSRRLDDWHRSMEHVPGGDLSEGSSLFREMMAMGVKPELAVRIKLVIMAHSAVKSRILRDALALLHALVAGRDPDPLKDVTKFLVRPEVQSARESLME
jgi:hypothetical protein